MKLEGLSVANGLRLIDKTFLRNFLKEDHIAFQRWILGESGRYPALAEVWFEAGPHRSRARIAEFLEAKQQQGEFKQKDSLVCAEIFHGMLVFDPVHLVMIGRPFNVKAVDQH